MKRAIMRLWLGVTLIALSSGVLLVSDWIQRRGGPQRLPRVALLRYASQPLLDEGMQGIVEGLADGGFHHGKTIHLEQFNAENDLGTANAIARQVTGGDYNLVVSSSTRFLQAVGNANRDGQVKHVFGFVADPYVAGVGLNPADPMDHPKHMVGLGTSFPVEKSFEIARKLYPGLNRVGVAWNPSEANSEALTIRARAICRKLGIVLVETAVESSSGVLEAANALVSRGIDALWIGGDVTVVVALDAVLSAARQGRIPVFSIMPPTAVRGSLFDMGANFYLIGKETGQLAAQVLQGADPAHLPIGNSITEKLMINRIAFRGLKDPWRLPEEVLRSADAIIDETGVHDKTPRPKARAST